MSQMHEQGRTQQRSRDKKTPPAPTRRTPWRWIIGACIAVAIVAVAIATSGNNDAGDTSSTAQRGATGLPDSPDYHSLIVSPDDSDHLFLGTHQGLFESKDGGERWRQTNAIAGDAMNLARDAKNSKVLYAAGHRLFQKSTDGGSTWTDIPLDDSIAQDLTQGGKGVDIHAFAADPTRTGTVYAAVAGLGLFRSTDAGAHFNKLSDTGAAGFGVAITPGKHQRIYLADAQRGLLVTTDSAKTWTPLRLRVSGVVVSPDDPQRVIAAGAELYLATDGRTFHSVQGGSEGGFGPLAVSPSDPKVAYAIALPGTLYVSRDGGSTWRKR